MLVYNLNVYLMRLTIKSNAELNDKRGGRILEQNQKH